MTPREPKCERSRFPTQAEYERCLDRKRKGQDPTAERLHAGLAMLEYTDGYDGEIDD